MTGRVEDPPTLHQFLIGLAVVIVTAVVGFLLFLLAAVVAEFGWWTLVFVPAVFVLTAAFVFFCTQLGRWVSRKMEEPR